MDLQESHIQTNPGGSSQPTIKVGDVVVMHDESLPRGLWKIQEIIAGRDGKIQGATVKVTSNNHIIPVASNSTVTLTVGSAHPLIAINTRDTHEHVSNNGAKETMAEVRVKFWIIKG